MANNLLVQMDVMPTKNQQLIIIIIIITFHCIMHFDLITTKFHTYFFLRITQDSWELLKTLGVKCQD